MEENSEGINYLKVDDEEKAQKKKYRLDSEYV